MRRIVGLLTAVGLVLGLMACRDQTPVYTKTYFDLFDTVTTFTVYTDDASAFTRFETVCRDELSACHRLFAVYGADPARPGSLAALNAAAGKAPVTLDKRVCQLLELGEWGYRLTNGRLNLLLGPALRLWHDCREQAENGGKAALPDPDALAGALRYSAPENLTYTGDTAQLSAGASLDAGAVGKGLAVERAACRLEAEGCVGLINAGGAVRTMGEKPGGGRWAVRIAHTLEEVTPSLDIRVGAHTAVSTSGDYQRSYRVDGVDYAHIIDPADGCPPRHMRAVTVICADAGQADVLSTALFVMPVREALSLVDSLDGVEAVVLDNALNWQYSAGFSAYLS